MVSVHTYGINKHPNTYIIVSGSENSVLLCYVNKIVTKMWFIFIRYILKQFP